MQIKKFVATGLSALMAGVTLAGGALAATQLGAYPDFLGSNGNLDAFVVVGATAAPSDVVGAIDVAASLASLSYTSVSTTGGSTTSSSGLVKDGIGLGTSSGGTSLATGTNAFPDATQVKNAQFSGLWTGTIAFNSSTYNAHEEVDVSGVRMRHDLGTDKINGTEKMEINTNADVVARYKFDTSIPNVGTIGTPQYAKPIKIKFLGKDFTVVGVGASSIKMLAGTVGTAVKEGNSVTGVSYTSGSTVYSVYVTAGANNDWSTLTIQDSTGKVLDTISNAKEGDTKQSSVTGLDVKVTDIRVSGTDPATQHIEADIVVGPTNQAEVEYDSSADVSSSSKERFPGEADWYITYSGTASGASGTIANGATINVEYRPTSDVYLIGGQSLKLPNSYGELGFDGFNTANFDTITIKPYGPATVYNSTDQSVPSTTMYGLEISSSIGNSVGSGAVASPNWWPAMYLLFNQSVTAGANGEFLPVFVGYKNTAGKIQISDQLTNGTTVGVTSGLASAPNATTELAYALINRSGGATDSVTFPFKLNYKGSGDNFFYANISVGPRNDRANLLTNITFSSQSISAGYASFQNRTKFTPDTAQLSTDLFRLGATSASSEEVELNITTEGSSQNAGKKSQEIVSDSGLLYQNPTDSGAGDKIVVKVPSKALQVAAHVGSIPGVTTTTTTGGTVKAVVPITNAVAKLDTEVGAAEKAKNLVLVGGPAVNSLTAAAMGLTFPAYGAASGIAEGTALIQIVDGAFTTGKVAVIVAGFEADDTRLATSVLQQASTKLKGQTASKATVSGTSVASAVITPVTASASTTTS